ncbi:hypothetical protein ACWD4N_45805 [Streptomyces sp. NPDC002586]
MPAEDPHTADVRTSGTGRGRWQNQGLGSHLTAQAIAEAATQDCHTVTVTFSATNIRAAAIVRGLNVPVPAPADGVIDISIRPQEELTAPTPPSRTELQRPDGARPSLYIDGPDNPDLVLVLAHGWQAAASVWDESSASSPGPAPASSATTSAGTATPPPAEPSRPSPSSPTT